MSERVMIVAESFGEFRRYCKENGLHPNQASYVRDETSLQGVGREVPIVWLEGSVMRNDFNRILAQVAGRRGTDEGLPRPVHELGSLKLGDRIRANGQIFTLHQTDADVEGNEQWTLVRRGSRTDRERNQSPRLEELSIPTTFGGMPIRVDPSLRPNEFQLRSIPPEDLYDIGERIVYIQKPCKCGYRAPELGPHPDCLMHGHDSPDRVYPIADEDVCSEEPNAGWPPQDS